jgi:hypothetical protein
MFLISIPVNMMFTSNQTLINFHINGSVEITPDWARLHAAVDR